MASDLANKPLLVGIRPAFDRKVGQSARRSCGVSSVPLQFVSSIEPGFRKRSKQSNALEQSNSSDDKNEKGKKD
jgi:hypothetical protein